MRGAPRPLAAATTETLATGASTEGAGNNGDPAQALARAGGTTPAPLGTAGIVAWGADPSETRVYLDDVPLPTLFHNGGVRGVISPAFIGSMQFTPGAAGPSYGRGLGGVVVLVTPGLALPARSSDRGTHKRVETTLFASPFDAGAAIVVRSGQEAALETRAAVRLGLLDRAAPTLFGHDRALLDQLAIPRYADAQTSLRVRISDREALGVLVVASNDERDTRGFSGANVRDFSRFLRFAIPYVYEGSDESVRITPFVGIDRRRTQTAFSAFNDVRASADETAFVHGVRATIRNRVPRAPSANQDTSLRIEGGLDAYATQTRNSRDGSRLLPAREGDPRLFGAVPSGVALSDRATSYLADVAPFVRLSFPLGRARFDLGLRVDLFLIDLAETTPAIGASPHVGATRVLPDVSPRVAVDYPLAATKTASVRTHFAFATVSRLPESADLSPVFGTPALGLSRALQAAFGLRGDLRKSGVRLTGSSELFGTASSALVVRSARANPEVARTLVQDGIGRAFGLQSRVDLAWKEKVNITFSWLASRSLRARDAGAGRVFRPADTDRPHVLQATVTARPHPQFSLSAAGRWASGLPRTALLADLSVYDANTGQFLPRFGAQNGERLPAFASLDVRASYTFIRSSPRADEATAERLTLAIDARNVTNARNGEEWLYAPNLQSRALLGGLPRTLTASAEVVF